MDERTRLLTGSGAPNNSIGCRAETDDSYVIEPIEDVKVISSDATTTGSESSSGPEGKRMPSS